MGSADGWSHRASDGFLPKTVGTVPAVQASLPPAAAPESANLTRSRPHQPDRDRGRPTAPPTLWFSRGRRQRPSRRHPAPAAPSRDLPPRLAPEPMRAIRGTATHAGTGIRSTRTGRAAIAAHAATGRADETDHGHAPDGPSSATRSRAAKGYSNRAFVPISVYFWANKWYHAIS